MFHTFTGMSSIFLKNPNTSTNIYRLRLKIETPHAIQPSKKSTYLIIHYDILETSNLRTSAISLVILIKTVDNFIG